jgi:single stranded DNA-binding protein
MSNPNIIISGRIGTDVESRKMNDGTLKVKFRVISSDRKKNESGQWEDKDTSGWTVVAWDNLATKALSSLYKGELITVQGSIKEVSWLDQEGNTKRSTETRASEISVNIYGMKQDPNQSTNDETQWL